MIHAVRAGDKDQADQAEKRLSTIRALTPIGSSDDVELRQITQLTGLGGDDDGFHRLVMDLHKALNRLAATYAQETLAGAHVYGLLPDDRPAIEAFMRGLEATKKLKFGHPGLATTATRTGGRLTISKRYRRDRCPCRCDRRRAGSRRRHLYRRASGARKFFVGLFRDFPVLWSGLERKSAAGPRRRRLLSRHRTLAVRQQRQPRRLSENLGASLVFLIDWNKARKILREWVPKSDAIRVLAWGRPIASATEPSSNSAAANLSQPQFITRHQHGSGSANAWTTRWVATPPSIFSRRFCGFRLTPCCKAVRSGWRGTASRRPWWRICSASKTHGGHDPPSRPGARNRHRHHTLRRRTKGAQTIRLRGLGRAGAAHRGKADRIALEARSEIARFDADRGIERLMDRIEDAIDELEQAAFMASLVPLMPRRRCSSPWPNCARQQLQGPRPPLPASPLRLRFPMGIASTPRTR